MQRLILASKEDAQEIFNVVQKTIREIYPKYYLSEIVDRFCEYHNISRIEEDIDAGKTYKLIVDDSIVGTGTIEGNHINRVYVLPEYQKKGYGSFIMSELEERIAQSFAKASIDASLPACRLYEKLGYKTIEHGTWDCEGGVIQVYEIMEKSLNNSEDMILRPYKTIDAEAIASWIKDEKTLRMWSSDRFGTYPVTAKDINYKYIDCNGDCEEPDNFYPLTAVIGGKAVGSMIIRYVGENTLRFGFVIVDDSIRGKGIGKKMILLAEKYAFDILGAKRITMGAFDNNPGALYCYKAAGFKETGKEIQIDILGEQWKDIELEMVK